MPSVEWRNETSEAWCVDDGILVIRRRVNQPMDGHDHHFVVDVLEPVAVLPIGNGRQVLGVK